MSKADLEQLVSIQVHTYNKIYYAQTNPCIAQTPNSQKTSRRKSRSLQLTSEQRMKKYANIHNSLQTYKNLKQVTSEYWIKTIQKYLQLLANLQKQKRVNQLLCIWSANGTMRNQGNDDNKRHATCMQYPQLPINSFLS